MKFIVYNNMSQDIKLNQNVLQKEKKIHFEQNIVKIKKLLLKTKSL